MLPPLTSTLIHEDNDDSSSMKQLQHESNSNTEYKSPSKSKNFVDHFIDVVDHSDPLELKKSVLKLLVVELIISIFEIFLISANFCAV